MPVLQPRVRDRARATGALQAEREVRITLGVGWRELEADLVTRGAREIKSAKKSDSGADKLPSPDKLRESLDQSIPGVPLVGTPDEVARGLERFAKSMRMTHLAVGMNFPGLDPAKSRRSMTLFAKEVLPTLR